MLDSLRKITDSESLNRFLQGIIFPETRFDAKIDLAKNWNLETENGVDYVKKNGLSIVCSGLKAFREKHLSHCLFAHRDMRSDVLGIPMVPGWQIALFDRCTDESTCDEEVIKLSVYNDVLTRDCYKFIYNVDEKQNQNTEGAEIPLETAEDDLLKPAPKRRKKT